MSDPELRDRMKRMRLAGDALASALTALRPAVANATRAIDDLVRLWDEAKL